MADGKGQIPNAKIAQIKKDSRGWKLLALGNDNNNQGTFPKVALCSGVHHMIIITLQFQTFVNKLPQKAKTLEGGEMAS